MDTRIGHVVAVKVIGSSWSRAQATQLRNLAFTSHPRIRLKSPFANAEKSKPQRVQMPFAPSTNSKRKIHSLNMICPFSSFGVRVPFGCELSNRRVPMSISYYGLTNGVHSTYFSSTTRLFSQVPGKGTLHDVWTDGKISGKNHLSKAFNRRPKLPQACAINKNETSEQELAVASESKAIGSKDVKLSTLNGNKDIDSSADIVSTQTTKGKEKLKRRSRSKKRQNPSSSGSTHSEAADMQNSSVNKLQGSEIGDTKHKLSHTPLQINSTSSSLTEATESSSSTKNSGKKPSKRSAKTRKPNVNSHSVPKLDEKIMVQSDSEIPEGHNSPLTNKSKSRIRKTWPQLYPPITKSVVIVESVTKAKIIQGYLGEMFEVLPSYGHVRDLAARSGSVRPDDDFSMVWEVPSPAWSHLKSIKVALSGAENLILASDPDREGEAIAWHIVEMLKQQDALQEHVTIARVTFNEVTESTVKSALQSPREINADLVHAYLAHRALDYLIGFNVSPLLWRKLPGCQSAGRVQSAALALICDREKEIDDFKTREYWIINAQFQKNDPVLGYSVSLSSHLTHSDSKRLHQTSISSNVEAKAIEEKINVSSFEVVGMKTSKIQRNPPAPYITSTLQQDAANKLNFAASYTMKLAQKLYEGFQLSDDKATGLITYMRTDGLHLSDEAAKGIQSFVAEKYGLNFATKNTRKYFKKVKTAQEAHEAIRPTDIQRLPSVLAGVLDEDSLKLYTLIWARTMACQMEPAIIEQIQCDIGNSDQSIMFRSTSSRLGFQGFKVVYEDTETIRIKNEDNEFHHRELFETLSGLKRGKPLSLIKVEPEQRYTQPPPRYSEGSLVKKLEELGIGRPSTYATTIKVLKDRNYIIVKNRTLYPEFRGRMVSAFLSHFFSEVTDYCFTADMETELDNVSAGITEWKGLLKDYWTRFSKYCQSASTVNMHQVEKILEKTFGDSLFSSLPDGDRTCPSCVEGTLVFKVSRFGAGYFIGCDQHPKCKYIAKTLYGEDDDEIESEEKKKTNVDEPKVLGVHPATNEKVLLKCGPYGSYVQLGEDRKGHSPKRASLAHIKKVDSVTLEDALDLLRYPLTLGNHPDDDKPVIVRLSRVGFAVKHRRCIATVPKNLKPGELTLEKAVELLKGNDVRMSGRPKRSPAVEEAIEAV